MKVTVISSCYGHYDAMWVPPAQTFDGDVDWVMVTDGPRWPGWRTVVERRDHVHPNVAAKVAKFRPDLYTLPGSEVSIWVDAGSWVPANFVDEVTSVAPVVADWLMYPHPHRVHLLPEVDASRGLRKYDRLDLEGQVAHYEAAGYPDNALWATGIIVRWGHSLHHQRFGEAWLTEVTRWGFQDQLSFAYLAWLHALPITPLGPDLFGSPFIQFTDHSTKP